MSGVCLSWDSEIAFIQIAYIDIEMRSTFGVESSEDCRIEWVWWEKSDGNFSMTIDRLNSLLLEKRSSVIKENLLHKGVKVHEYEAMSSDDYVAKKNKDFLSHV